MGTRLRVALVGQATEHRLIKLEPAGTQEGLRDLLITRGLDALGVVPLPTSIGQVKIFLDGGAVLDDAALLEKDDTVYFSVDGGPWRDPNEMPPPRGGPAPDADDGVQPKPQSTKVFLPERSVASFFGSGLRREVTRSSTGERVETSKLLSQEELHSRPESSAGACLKCGRTFVTAGPRAMHERFCRGPGAAVLAYVARGAAETAAAAAAAATAAAPAAATADTAGPSVDTDAELRAKVPKLRKDGGVKQSGLRQGDSKGITHTLYFKLEVEPSPSPSPSPPSSPSPSPPYPHPHPQPHPHPHPHPHPSPNLSLSLNPNPRW